MRFTKLTNSLTDLPLWHSETSGNIQSWAEEDRPREKLMLKGKAALSEAELIAILIY